MNEVSMVHKLLEGIDSIRDRATNSITSIATISEESAAAIEEVLATGQEQLSEADKLVNMSIGLGDIIEKMRVQMNQFHME